MRLRPALLTVLFSLAALGRSDAQDPPPGQGGEIAGETFTVEGVTDTVDAIMARDAALPAGALYIREKPEPRRRREKQPNPDAPAVAQWPPAETDEVPELLRSPGRSPQTVGTNFLAIVLGESGFIPPDSMGAVGPTQVMAVANGRIKVFGKDGTPGALNTTTDNFFASVGGNANGTTDPHIRYDRLSQRWFVVMIDIGAPTCPNHILMAVSDGPTITGTSNFTYFSFVGEPNHFTDYPTLGVDASALYIGANMFDDPAVGCSGPFDPFQTTVWIVNKASMIAGTPTITAFRGLIGASSGILTPQGVDNDDPAATQGYFAGVDAIAFSKLILKRVSTPGGTPTLSADIALTVPTTTFPQPQPQPAPGPNLDALDDRLFAAAIHRDRISGRTSLWTAHNIEVNASCVGNTAGNRNGSRWYEIENLGTTPSLRQSGTLCDPAGATPFGYWIPSVAISGQGHMALGASRASTNSTGGHASVIASGRLRGDALGSTQAPTLVQPSTFSYFTGVTNPERWGDYSQVVVDPNDDQTMWTFQEYANATDSWGVRVTQLMAPPPATPSAASPASVAPGQPSIDVVITGTSAAGSEFFDPGDDAGGPGFTNHIAAAISGGVTVNAVTFNSPTQVTVDISTVGAPTGPKDVTITNPDGQSRTGLSLISVVAGCPTITVNPAAVPPGTAGTAYSQTFTQTGGTAPVTFGLAGTLPAGLSFNAGTATLSGTPTQTGSFNFIVTATDANNCTGSRDYTLVVNCQAITVNPTTIPNGTAGSPYSQTFTQTGGIGAVTWSLTGALPTGLSFNTSTGVLSGTPTQTGSFPITVTATDANGCAGSRAYTLVINCQAITVNPTTIPNGTAGSPYSQTFTQTGGIGAVTWSLTGALPTGLSLNTSTGVLSGTPTQTGSFPITVTATDANGCVGSRGYTLVINCQAITVNPTTIPSGTAGSPYSQTFTQTGGIGAVTWSLAGTLPTGLSFNTSTGVLSGTPTQTGSFPITVMATDSNGCGGSRAYTLVINCQAITVNPTTIPNGTAGSAYSQTFTQAGGIGTITWSLTGTLPTGLSFNTSTGVLSGTPTQTGSFPITVTATDANGCMGNRAYTLVINCQVITVNPATIPSGTAGSPYSQTFTQTGGIGAITWSLTGTLPTGLSLNTSTGVLSGTPTQTGSFPITVTATDANGCVGSRSYTLVINCQAITVNPATIPSGTAGSPYSQTFTQTGGIGAVTWSLAGTLPTGLSFNTSTGVLSGTPTQMGSFPITVTATDGNGCAGSRAYTLVVNCQAITVNPTTIPNGVARTPYSQTFTQTGGTGTISWSLTGTLPAGLSFNTTTGVLSGTPTQVGSFPITVNATDANGCVGTRNYTLVIECQIITVLPTSIPNGTAGSLYTVNFVQQNGLGPITWSVTGALPAGLTLDPSSGQLSGTPTQTGSFPIAVSATDGNGCVGTRSYTLVINCAAITVNPTTIPNATAGTAYSQTFTQTGGIGAITWSLAGTLPTGLGFNTSTGVLSGTPTQTGSFPITVTATDANGCIGSRQYTLVVDRAGPFVPTALAVDGAGNRVLDAGEVAVVAPSWRNDTGAAETVTGAATSFTGPGTSTYTIVDAAADYGLVAAGATATCSPAANCYAFTVSVPNPRPALHWDSTFLETLSSTDTRTWTLHLGGSFTDVPGTNGFYRFVETLLHRGVTGGCGPDNYCPAASTSREQMAVFVLVGKEGAGYQPPACTTAMFGDVPASSPFCRWIEELARRGVVAGCGGGNYCPQTAVTREQMSVFVLRTLDPALDPPACTTPMFGDVPASNPFCRWIEELVRRGVVSGCGGGNYCPTAPVTREQMGVFITVTFGLTLYGP